MRGIHFLTFLVIKGATSFESVTVKEGDPVTQLLNISDLKPISKLTIQKNFDNGTIGLLVRVCSHDEEKTGCNNITSPRVSVQIFDDAVNVTFNNFTAGDAGYHIIEVTGKNLRTKEKRFNVTVEQLEINSSSTPPPSTTSQNMFHDSTFKVIATFVVLGLACWSCFLYGSCCRKS